MTKLLIFLFACCYFVCLARNLPQYEIDALRDLYDSTDGNNWLWDLNEPISTEWNFNSSNVNPCRDQWQGITCRNSTTNSSVANVIKLVLEQYRLVGTLPPSIGNFSLMYELDLDSNRISGLIPEAVGKLSGLLILKLGNNSLSNTVPESIYDLTSMVVFDLTNNYLNGTISSSIGNFGAVTTLQLSYNEFTGTLPASLNDCSKLSLIEITDNHLQGPIPFVLGSFPSLQYFDLEDNALSGTLPDNFGTDCSDSLTYFSVDSNQLNGSLPLSLNDCINLEELYMTENNFNGTIPDYVFDSLLYFYLNFNLLSGPIPLTFSVDQLVQLDFAGNRLNGSIPAYLLNGSIEIIDLSQNQLTGSLVYGINPVLDDFNVADNLLTGTLPPGMFTGDMSQLQLSVNFFHGTLPNEFCSEMAYLAVDGNQLEGTLPPALTTLKELVSINFASNHFDGPFLEFSAAGIEALQFSDNLLSGTIPGVVLTSNQLLFLNLGNNFLTGTIPAQGLATMTAMTNFNLFNNLLTGSLPPEVSKLPSIQSIFFDGNMLTGDLGAMFDGSVQQVLKFVDVSNNQIQGTIPSSPFQIPSLLSFAAVSNCLYGSLPAADICALRNLTTLALDGMESASSCQDVFFPNAPYIYQAYGIQNKVNGPIDPCLFNMTSLTTLHLSGNAITGSIPDGVILSEALSDLSLSHNSLTGSIPDSIQMRSWTNLDLSYNKLTGGLSHQFPQLAEDASLSLEVNRLSGVIPHNLKHAKTIDILDGNLWKCDTERTQLPDNDKNAAIYECGSNTFNYSVYIWLVLAVVTSCGAGYAWLRAADSDTQSWVHRLRADFTSWLTVFTPTDRKELSEVNLSSLGEFANGMRRSMVWITLFIAVVLMPAYIALSFTENTYAYEYAWTVSAAYLSGPVSTGVLMAGFGLLAILSIVAVHLFVNRNLTKAISMSPDFESRSYTVGLVASFAAVILLNVVLVTAVNIAYVYVHVTYGAAAVYMTQFALAVFKLFWNNWAVRELLKLTKQIEQGDYTRVGVEVFMILFNNLGAPFIATAFVSTNCFYNVIAAPPKVHVSYTYTACIASNYYTNGSTCTLSSNQRWSCRNHHLWSDRTS